MQVAIIIKKNDSDAPKYVDMLSSMHDEVKKRYPEFCEPVIHITERQILCDHIFNITETLSNNTFEIKCIKCGTTFIVPFPAGFED